MDAAVVVACPKDYEFAFRKYRAFLYGVVYHSGVPHYSVEDASGDIFVRMLAQDGLANFDGSFEDSPAQAKAYLASYFSLGARAERSRICGRAKRSVALEALPDLEDDHPAASQDGGLLDRLLSISHDDARHFIEVAAQHSSYAKARNALVGEGWDSGRIRRAVREARSIVRQHQLCMSQ